MAVAATTLLPLLPLLPCAHLLVPCERRRERKIGKEGQRRKNCIWGLQEKGKRGFSSISVKRVLVGSPVAIPLGRIVINLLSRFSGHSGAYESNHFLEQRRRIVMTTISTTTSNEGEEA